MNRRRALHSTHVLRSARDVGRGGGVRDCDAAGCAACRPRSSTEASRNGGPSKPHFRTWAGSHSRASATNEGRRSQPCHGARTGLRAAANGRRPAPDRDRHGDTMSGSYTTWTYVQSPAVTSHIDTMLHGTTRDSRVAVKCWARLAAPRLSGSLTPAGSGAVCGGNCHR
jgi:hypothetical protein